MNKYSAKVYVKDGSWSAYVISDDGIGAPITIGVNQSTMDPDIYAEGWKAYAEDKVSKGWDVKVISL